MLKHRFTFLFAALAILFFGLFIGAVSQAKINYLPFGLLGKSDAPLSGVAISTVQTSAVKLPTELSFAGEKVPLEDLEVRERLDREILVNTYWQSSTLLMLKRANRWFPAIEKILKENDVPDDFKYLALIESGLTDVVSPSGAAGFWQFLKATGQQYGLLINDEVDERYDVEKATLAACVYLKKAKEELGSWTNAAAGYNAGSGGITKQMERQAETGYYDLLLNSETSRYVFRILAMKLIWENPKDFGYFFEKDDMYPPYEFSTVTVSGAVPSWPAYAKNYNITYKELKMLNPWLRDVSLKNYEAKTYEVKILKKGGRF